MVSVQLRSDEEDDDDAHFKMNSGLHRKILAHYQTPSMYSYTASNEA